LAGSLESYRFRGLQAEGQADSLSGALDDLGDFWGSRPSLVTHAWGVLTLRITIGSTEAVIELTDPDLLDDIEAGNYTSLIDKLAKDMNLEPRDARVLLDEASSVTATVDRIRPPTQPRAWQAEPDMEPGTVLPDATAAWIRDVAKEVDREASRQKGRVRTRRGKALLRMVVDAGGQRGLSDAEISKRTGVARSTVRDARQRLERDKRVVTAFRTRRPGQRYTPDQQKLVLVRLNEAKGNAAETARRLGIAPRTVRDIRARAAVKVGVAKRYTQADRNKLMKLVDTGLTPTAAGRKLGVAGRTARNWAQKAGTDDKSKK